LFPLPQCPILGAKRERTRSHCLHIRPYKGGSGTTSVEIADVEAALGKVRNFIELLEQNHAEWNRVGANPPTPLLKQTNAQINQQLPLIARIAARADADLADNTKPRHSSYGWSYYAVQEASEQLAGLLSSLGEAESILGPRACRRASICLC